MLKQIIGLYYINVSSGRGLEHQCNVKKKRVHDDSVYLLFTVNMR